MKNSKNIVIDSVDILFNTGKKGGGITCVSDPEVYADNDGQIILYDVLIYGNASNRGAGIYTNYSNIHIFLFIISRLKKKK